MKERYPSLSLSDLYRKSTEDKRKLGDTHRPDGVLWVIGGLNQVHSTSAAMLALPGFVTDASQQQQEDAEDEDVDAEYHGVDLTKLWNPVIGLTDVELGEWEHEGNLTRMNLLTSLDAIFQQKIKCSGTVPGRRCCDGWKNLN